MKKLTHLLFLGLCLLGCQSTPERETKTIKVEPISIQMDVNVKVTADPAAEKTEEENEKENQEG